VLEAHGYQVLLAGDGTEALSLFAQDPGKIAAVLTDLMMPLLDGVALIRTIHKMRPGLAVIASTGLGEKQHLDKLKTMGIENLLSKPYSAGTLLRMIHHALHAVDGA
jgi:CheY-like chemotaxis protein